ncbi:hypothetical protein CHLNCDRAFT_140221 [Chlorella variabilis]|uniref:Uncharacterized protein n=1 Tax=Chlorella variabilis TaxID=554065 RepID=E1ZRT9_CHLVA|nr:hypothetical protein CHLNCDRAFT_140221 [Chlorella variabilis]EFN51472.1 hypothetical protein CHLNCDRAFT_140221 [Chlorella variabilis]|eukprot:XP_005843574.1 hypothetical protein CHLNCDRAFT_140221 [Chlorella variabilis]
MEAKQAYQQLLEERQGRGSSTSRRSAADGGRRGQQAGAGGGTAYGQSSQPQQPRVSPESYSFGDLVRDLDRELSGYAQRRQQARASGGATSAAAPKSLWEELYDIGEEFVDFLEQGLGVSDDEASAYGALKKTYGDLSGRSTDATSTSGATTASSSRTPRVSVPGGSRGGEGAAKGEPQAERKPTTAEYVAEELAALKRKMGKQ